MQKIIKFDKFIPARVGLNVQFWPNKILGEFFMETKKAKMNKLQKKESEKDDVLKIQDFLQKQTQSS